MNEMYSRPLSKEAREKLTDWIESYIVTLTGTHADHRAEVSKRKAIEALQTDIDILVFVMAIAVLFTEPVAILIRTAVIGNMDPRAAASTIVEGLGESLRIDKQMRTS